MKTTTLLWTACALIPLAAFSATPGVDAPPEPAPPRPVVVPVITEHQLPNGVTVVIAPRHDVPLVTATLFVRVGVEADPADRAGLASMTATLLAKGAQRGGRAVSATALAREAEALGSSLDTGTGWRSSSAAMTVTTTRLAPALALIADVMRRPTLAAPELERARTQALDALRVAMSNPGEVAGLAMRRAFWGGSAFGAVATPASFQRMTRGDVEAFHKRWYRPDLAVLVLAGDVKPEQGIALARRTLGDWKAPAAARATLKLDPAAPLPQPLALIDMPGSGQSGVVVAAPFVPLGAPERRIAQVANAVLGGGYSARLNQEVRIKRGLSYGASSGAESHEVGGMFSAHAQTNHPTAAEVLQLLRSEITRLAAEAPPREELAARQATLVGSFARRLETTGGLAAQIAGLIINGRPLSELKTYVDEVLAVTPEQVRDFAARYWKDSAMRGVIAGDLKAGGDRVKALEAGALVVPATALDLEQPGLVRR
jgi:zinc protease